MDVNTRIDHMDEELKLVKNEIKQVLIEIAEHVLNVQNPFSAVVVGSRNDDFTESGSAPAPASVDAAAPVQDASAQTPQVPEQQMSPANPQFPGAGTGQGGFPGQQGQAAAYQNYPGQQDMGGPAYPGFNGQADGLQDPAAGVPGADWDEQERRTGTFGDRRFDVGDELLGDYDLGDMGDLGDDDGSDWAEQEDDDMGFGEGNVDRGDGFEDDYETEDEAEEGDDAYESDDEESAPKRSKMAKNDVDEEPDVQDPTVGLDLVTLASLVQWTDRVVQRAGPEYLEALFEISEMTGRLSMELKNTLLVLVRLLSIEVNGSSVGATETVRLLAQLDGLMGNTTKEDARLLPFILDGNNLEVLSLIQP